MNCASIERYAEAFIDGEVDASARIELERHVAGCRQCRERIEFASWFKGRLRTHAQTKAPEALRSRVRQALTEERSGGAVRLDGNWRATAAAAAVALLLFGVGRSLERGGDVLQAGVAPLLEDVVRAHARPYPAEVARGDQVPAYFESRVGFPVRPVEFGDPSVHFLGARSAEVGGRRAVTLQYEAHGRRMTVVAFRAPARAGEFGERIETGGRTIRYVRVQGHLVPLMEHRGVLYAVVGDLEPEDRIRMAAGALLR
jgi:anti-sigma factor (TIGR02949 family)